MRQRRKGGGGDGWLNEGNKRGRAGEREMGAGRERKE